MSKTGQQVVKSSEEQDGSMYDQYWDCNEQSESANELPEDEKQELNEIYTQQEQENAKHQ